MMPWLLLATWKRVNILQWEGYFLGERKVLKYLCKVFNFCKPSSKSGTPFKIYQECPNVDN